MKNTIFLLIITLIAVAGLIVISCTSRKPVETPKPTEVKNLDWVKNAVIYEANIRQFSKEGTFKAFAKDLPRLKELGIDIIWVMPVNPIGEKERKGPLGSYYSVRDYKAINPEYGTMDDFKAMVEETHKLGMKFIIDWVPNHSSWDNPMVTEHPEYYLRDSTGKMVSPFDWTDVVRFNYNSPSMRKWMIETMKFWLTETGIDGFRCDVAHMVPVSFWDSCRMELDKVKPIFFLAEADQPELHAKAYDASYDWKFHHLMNQVAKGKKNANDIEKYFAWVDSVYPVGSILMEFTSNHDENSWNGTEFERMGDGVKTFAVLSATVPGMLLIYNGQEAAFNRRLKFFEKDSISWGNYSYSEFYKNLIQLKKDNKALWNGIAGGSFKRIELTDTKNVIAFVREKEGNKVVVIINISKKPRTFMICTNIVDGKYKDVFSGQETELKKYSKMELAPWNYRVLELK
jgi:cyclomaltodextrinase / maltogenic alpha-amylase / neopullulanase